MFDWFDFKKFIVAFIDAMHLKRKNRISSPLVGFLYCITLSFLPYRISLTKLVVFDDYLRKATQYHVDVAVAEGKLLWAHSHMGTLSCAKLRHYKLLLLPIPKVGLI